MIGLAHHQPEIARGFSLLPACAIGRPASHSLLGRAATLNNTQHQRLTRTERGKLVGMCASTLGVAKTGRRFAGLGCHRRGFELSAARGYDLLTRLGGGFGPRPFGQFDGIGAVAAVPFANLIRNTADHSLHNAVEPFKRHFSISASDRSNPISGAKYAVPHTRVSGTQDDR